MLEIADAVVVGGGALGLGVAEALSRRLSRVLLVEAGRCGARATAGGFAWVNASSKANDETYHRLNAEACRVHLAMAADGDAARTGWNGGGSLTWARQSDAAAMAELIQRLETLQAWNYPVVRVSRGEMQALEPYVRFDEDVVGMFAPSEGWISTPRLMRFYGEQARERHAAIAEFTEVTGFTLDHRGAVQSVETSAGRVATRVVVICAGTESGRLAGLLVQHPNPITDRLVTRSPGLLVESGPLPADACVHRVCFPAQASGFHLRPTPEGGMLLGADDTDADTARASGAQNSALAAIEQAHANGAALLMERAAVVLPSLDTAAKLSSRTCVRPVPSDGLPVVGDLPWAPGAYLLVTHSGLTLGPLLSLLLAGEIVTGQNSPWLAPYRPERFYR